MEIKGGTFRQSFLFIEESKKAPNIKQMQQGCNFSSWACIGEREAQWQSSWEDNQWSSTGTPAHAIYAQWQTPANRKLLMKRCFRPVSLWHLCIQVAFKVLIVQFMEKTSCERNTWKKTWQKCGIVPTSQLFESAWDWRQWPNVRIHRKMWTLLIDGEGNL